MRPSLEGAPILLVEDDPDVARLVTTQLQREGLAVVVNATGAGVLEQVVELGPRLVILDLMLPQAHGLEVLRRLRRDPRYRGLPVVVLTALGAETDRVQGLDLGADDYIHKPFSPRELAARVRARLRLAPPPAATVLRAGPFELDLQLRRAQKAGRLLALSDTEFRLLALLAGAPGRVFTRPEIVAAVWSPQHFIARRAIDVYVRRLRTKIEADPQRPVFLQLVRRVGYRFLLPEAE